MDPNLITAEQAVKSLTNIAPFLWPFVLLSLGVALTPVSPISWSYSTWLLFIIPLTLTVFAPVRAFSGPLRYGYLEYASKIGSLVVTLLKAVVVHFHAIPTLALPALFFLPVLPILFFVVFPAIPVIWHYVTYHYHRRLKAVTTSMDKTNASLDLAMVRAKQGLSLALTFEKQALYTVSAARCTPLLAFSRYSTDFGASNDVEGHLRLAQNPGTLGGDLTDRVLDAEKQIAVIEDESLALRALTKHAISVATRGDMVDGEGLADDAVKSLENIVKLVAELYATADHARCTWVEFRRRFNKVVSSASATTATLEFVITRAQRAAGLAHTYETEALAFVSTTGRIASQTIALHDADFFESSAPVQQARQAISNEATNARTLGSSIADRVILVDAKIGDIEIEAEDIRVKLQRALTATAEGDVAGGESLTVDAANSLANLVESAQELTFASEEVRQVWVQLSVEAWTIP
ncbi:hypothetical protein H0H93_009090 [Arthromyces matolae]|nr:hypothetical protein H0H93_009090 [Arthromyces matolae]